MEAGMQRELGNTLDYAEGVKAFIAKRPPVFVGQ
jgi:enoyl-CoA hydratase/carnithine racemase